MRRVNEVFVAAIVLAGVMACHETSAPVTAPSVPTAADTHYFVWAPLNSPPGLDYSGAYAINDGEEIAGFAYADTTTGPQPYAWHNGSPAPLSLGTGNQYLKGEARSVNNTGTIVGWLGNGAARRAASWSTAGAPPIILGTLGNTSWSNDINAGGTIVGGMTLSVGSAAFVWDATHQMRALPGPAGKSAGEARAINDQGTVVGWVYDGSCARAVEWVATRVTPGSYHFLAPAGVCSVATDINFKGIIVGTMQTAPGGGWEAYKFALGAAPVNLWPVNDIYNSLEARSVNPAGRITISDYLVWGNAYGDMIDLNGQLTYPSDPRLPGPLWSTTFGLNTCGVIVGLNFTAHSGSPFSETFTEPHAAIWRDPVPGACDGP
jgi:uncharacterized membrane protein